MEEARKLKRDFEQVLELVEGQASSYASEYPGLSLEARRECREKVEKTLKTLQKISKDLQEDGEETVVDNKTASLARHSELRNELQHLYNGQAVSYDPTASHGGCLYPPHGMCFAESVLKMADLFHSQIAAVEKGIAQMEDELKKNPYVPSSPHPMIVLQSGETARGFNGLDRRAVSHPDKRNEIIRRIGNAMADKLSAQDGLKFWSTVRPASAEYMQKINGMFIEKNQLRHKLLEEDGIVVPAW
jgi:hypothetical protein